MKNIFLKILGFMTNRKVVLLKHFDGQISYSLAKQSDWSPFESSCYVYHFTKLGFVVLNQDGTTSGASYVHYWKYL